jgi:predicted RNA binding protein YcfA (HicA-like mRNA interferase family)
MAGLPAVPGTEVAKALERAGFAVVRVSGSHHVLRHSDGRVVVVPVHPGKDMAKGTLRSILRLAGITDDELRRLLSSRGERGDFPRN